MAPALEGEPAVSQAWHVSLLLAHGDARCWGKLLPIGPLLAWPGAEASFFMPQVPQGSRHMPLVVLQEQPFERETRLALIGPSLSAGTLTHTEPLA